MTKEKCKNFKCPECKCFLRSVYPNSDASIACDEKCYFSEGEEGEQYLQRYINKYPKEWKELNK